MKPLVSIITSSFNNSRDIPKMMESVLNQTHTNWELLISDDGSSDNSREIIDRYTDPRIKKFHSPQNRGIVKQMSVLLERAQGDFITPLDADDMFAPDKLELQVAAFTKNPNLSVCLCIVAIVDENDQVLQVANHYPLDHQGIINFIDTRHAFPCGNMNSMMFKKESINKHKGYHQYWHGTGGHDLDWILRILTDGKEVVAVPKVLYYWRKHAFSFSRKINKDPIRNQVHDLCYLLYEQRKKHQKDDLTGLESGELAALRQKILDDYQQDPSRIYREICNSRDLPYKVRLEHGLQSIKLNPWHQKNYRYFIKSAFRWK
jgi:glycosyltransferase involved in cell wall biosynthesis